MLNLVTLLLGLDGTAVPPWDGTVCLSGLCPVMNRAGPPPGLGFLLLGIWALGVNAVWQRRKRST